MSELRNYILSKLQEMTDQTPAKKPAPRRKRTSQSAEAAKKAASDSKFRGIFDMINAGPSAPRSKQQPKPENSSTDLRTQLAYVLADKLEEYRGKRFGYEPGEAPARGEGALKTAVGDALSKMRYGTTKPAKVEGGVIQDPGTRGGISTPVRKGLGRLSATKRWETLAEKPGMPKLPPRADKEPKPEKPLKRKYVGKPKPPVTEWKARIAQILADKIDEIIKPDPRTEKLVNPFKPEPLVKPEPLDLSKLSAPDPKLTDKLKKIIKPKPATPKVESTNLKDRMVEALTQKLTESPMEITHGRETPEQKEKNEARLKQLRAKKAKKPPRESNPEAGGGEGTKPGSYFTNRHGGRTEN